MLLRLEILKANMNAMFAPQDINNENANTDEEGFIEQIQSYIEESYKKDTPDTSGAN